MDDQTKAAFDTYFELFSSRGWQMFITDLESSRDEFNSVDTIKDGKELYRAKGKLECIDSILNMEHMMQLAYEQAQEAGSDA